MGIDRIRRSESTSVTSQAPAASGSGRTFSMGPMRAATAPAGPVTPLSRFKNGEIDRAGYIEEHVQQATAHLQGLDGEMREHVCESLRQACESSPLLSELVARATG